MPPEDQTTSSNQSNQLDPQVVDLAKSIRQVESGGNFGAKGKSGEFGAYQWMPQTWQEQSQAAGVNVPLDQSTPEQQNEVAYKTIKAMKDKGMNVGEIASSWNSGDPSAYTGYFSDGIPSVGVNKEGVNYNVPDYAKKVATAYQALKGANPTSQSSAPVSQPASQDTGQTPDWASIALGAGSGILSFLGSHIPTIAGLGVGALTESPTAGIATDLALQGVLGGGGTTPPGGTSGDTSGAGAGGQQPDAMQELASLSQPQSSKDSNALSNLLNEALQARQGDREFSQSNSGAQGIATAGLYGYTPEVVNGNMDFSASQEKADNNIKQAANIEAMAAEGSQIPMMAVMNEAGKYLGKNRMMSPDVRQKAAEYVGEYARAYAPSNKSIEGSKAIRGRQQQYAQISGNNWMKLSAPQIEARKALAHGFRTASLNYSKNKELQEAAIKEQQKHINAKEVMNRLQQKKAPRPQQNRIKSGLGKLITRSLEVWIGDKIGGPTGAVLSYLVGEYFEGKRQRKAAITKFDTPQMKKVFAELHKKEPRVYGELIRKLEEAGVNIPETEGKMKGLIKPPKSKSPQPEQIQAQGLPNQPA